MTKGICDLRKFLHKVGVLLTKVWLLIVNDLTTMRKCAYINNLGDSYSQKPLQTGSEGDFFVRVDPRIFMSNTYTTNLS